MHQALFFIFYNVLILFYTRKHLEIVFLTLAALIYKGNVLSINMINMTHVFSAMVIYGCVYFFNKVTDRLPIIRKKEIQVLFL